MKLDRRVRSVERQLGRPWEVRWQDAYAAWDRMQARLLATCRALAEGRERPVHDPVLVEADAQVLRRWRRQRGIQEIDPEDARAKLEMYLRRLAEHAQGGPRPGATP